MASARSPVAIVVDYHRRVDWIKFFWLVKVKYKNNVGSCAKAVRLSGGQAGSHARHSACVLSDEER